MANSTTNIDLVAQAQASKEITANAALDAASQAMTYGRRQSTCSGLTWGYYGGNVTLSGGTMSQIANGTLTLTASATNYVVSNKATGAVSASTSATNWNDSANYWRLYSVVSGASTVTSYTDSRELAKYTGGGGGSGDMILASDQTVTGAKTFKAATLLLRNIADTFSSLFSNSATAARTWTLQDRNGILADDTDLALKAPIASPSFTGTLAHSGDVLLSGSGKRITGDMSNSTPSNRLHVQTSTTNGVSTLGVLPNGSATTSAIRASNSSDPDNCSFVTAYATATQTVLASGKLGTGTYKPLAINVGSADVATWSEAAATLGDMTASIARASVLNYTVSNTDAGGSAQFRVIGASGALAMLKTSTFGALSCLGGALYVGTADANTLVLRANAADVMQITAAGNSLHVSPSGGRGYGVGAGGTVTQPTSRTTGVAINKPNGDITLFTAAGSATPATFTVSNNLVGLYDVPTIAVRGATNKYITQITNVVAGTSFDITYWTTGGTATDTPIFHFNLGKGSIA